MTEAMPFLQKAILLSYDPRPFRRDIFVKGYLLLGCPFSTLLVPCSIR